MHQLLNGQIVDDQKYQELKELQEVEAVEAEVSKLTFDRVEHEWDKIMKMTASDFINCIKI